jgi:hypothetical protein
MADRPTLHDLVMAGQIAYNQAYAGNETSQGYVAERARVAAILEFLAQSVEDGDFVGDGWQLVDHHDLRAIAAEAGEVER